MLVPRVIESALTVAVAIVMAGARPVLAGSCEHVVLVSPNPTEHARVGSALDFEDDLLVAGASDDLGAAGAAYVFRRVDGAWTDDAVLVPPDAGTFDHFGAAVAVSGDRVVAGASLSGFPDVHPGAAYVFHHDGTDWAFEAKLNGSDATNGAYFGVRVAMWDDVIVVGAPFDGVGGAAYVFRRSGTDGWQEETKLQADPVQPSDYFGIAVAVRDDVIAVGAGANNGGPGSVHVFRHVDGAWTTEQELLAADGAPGDSLGSSLALGENTIVASAPDAGTGTVYEFRRVGGAWQQTDRVVGWDVDTNDGFGWWLDMDGTTMIVGASDATGTFFESGAAYVYRHDGHDWQPEVKLIGSRTEQHSGYGSKVALSGRSAAVFASTVIGAPTSAGAVFMHDAEFIGPDCNGDLVDDPCEVAAGIDEDCDGDGVLDSCEPCPGDINCSGDVGFGDLLEVLAFWGGCLPVSPRPEAEPCGDDVNGGCNLDFDDPPLEPLLCNETVEGTFWWNGTIRDTDWYGVEVVEPMSVTISVTLGAAGLLVRPAASCNLPSWVQFATGAAGQTIGFTTPELEPGTHWFLVMPDFQGPVFPCGGEEAAYVLSLTCEPDPPCGADANDDGAVNFLDVLLVISFWGPCP